MAKVVFLTRGDARWGLGHLYRTSWMATALAAGGAFHQVNVISLDSTSARTFWADRDIQVTFIADVSPAGIAAAVSSPGNAPTDVLVIDWLDSPPVLLEELAGLADRLVLLDDYGPAGSKADLVVNSLLAPVPRVDTVVDCTHIVSGIDYVQLSPSVVKLRNVTIPTIKAMESELSSPVQSKSPVQAILVSFGGAAQPVTMATVLKALVEADYGGRVVAMPIPESGFTPPPGLDVELRPAGPDYHSVLAASDLAILGGGLSLYEAAYLGVPAAATAIPSATPGYEDHQLKTIGKMVRAGSCRSLGHSEDLTVCRVASALDDILHDVVVRGKMSVAGMNLVDGRGLDRTIALICELIE